MLTPTRLVLASFALVAATVLATTAMVSAQQEPAQPDPMAGMDPVALGKKYGHRVIEYHFKDTGRADRGGGCESASRTGARAE